MKQQNNAQVAGKRKQIAALIWRCMIIIGTYFLFRLVFLIFGLHLYAAALGGCLAIIPYLVAAIYLW